MAKKKLLSKHGKHHWTGVEPDPDDNMGFIYLITNKVNGRLYIGKKQYWMAKQRVKGCKSKVSDKQSPKWKECCWTPSNWRVYSGSSKSLTKDLKQYGGGNFTYEILKNCRSKGVLHYSEIEEQVVRGVLWKKMDGGDDDGEYLYYNRQIAACRFRPPNYTGIEDAREINTQGEAI